MDGAQEKVSGEPKRLCQKLQCDVKQLQPGTPWFNRAESNFGILKARFRKELNDNDSTMVLWCYCAERQTKILYSNFWNIYILNGQTPYSKLLGIRMGILKGRKLQVPLPK